MDNLDLIYPQVKEVKETDNWLECNRLLDTGEWIFLNVYKTNALIASNEYSNEIHYCLGKII